MNYATGEKSRISVTALRFPVANGTDITVNQCKFLCYYIVEIATLYVKTTDCMSRQRSKEMLGS